MTRRLPGARIYMPAKLRGIGIDPILAPAGEEEESERDLFGFVRMDWIASCSMEHDPAEQAARP